MWLDGAGRVISPVIPVLDSTLLNIVSHKLSLLLDEERVDETHFSTTGMPPEG